MLHKLETTKVDNMTRMNIPKGEVHEIMVTFREDIAVGTMTKFCSEFDPRLEYTEEFGIECYFDADDDAMEYFDQVYGCYAISITCDMDQKGGESSFKQTRKETRTLPVTRHGNSLTVNVTPMCKNLGVSQGDSVKTTLETVEGNQLWGIFDSDGNLNTDPEPMVFKTRQEAMEMLSSDAYDSDDGHYVDRVI